MLLIDQVKGLWGRKKGIDRVSVEELKHEKIRLEQLERRVGNEVDQIEAHKNELFMKGKDENSSRQRLTLAQDQRVRCPGPRQESTTGLLSQAPADCRRTATDQREHSDAPRVEGRFGHHQHVGRGVDRLRRAGHGSGPVRNGEIYQPAGVSGRSHGGRSGCRDRQRRDGHRGGDGTGGTLPRRPDVLMASPKPRNRLTRS